MRYFPIVLCVSALCSGYASLASAGAPGSLSFTFDLLGPCTPSGCTPGTQHPTDIDLNLTGNSFSYAPGAAGAFVTTMAIDSPVVCDEVSSGGLLGPATSQQVAPAFTNPATSGAGLLEFNAGGPSIVDTGAFSYDGASPPGVATSYSNAGGTIPQVICYRINAVTGGPIALAPGPSGIFKGGFEAIDGHRQDEPWVSVQTVVSPTSAAGRGQTSGATDTNAMNFVVQVHNASSAVNWHLAVGYDYAFFDPIISLVPPKWCVLGPSIAMPGAISGSCAHNGTVSSAYTLAAADIHSDTNSVYIYMQYEGSAAAVSNWSSLSSAVYPAVAALFPPYGTYPQRFDDKVAVAHANNRPTFNIGSIVCSNDTTSTSCTLLDQDGRPVPTALKFQNSISSGAVTVDPIAYFVDPTLDTTLPGNLANDAISVSNVSCSDPSGILAGSIGNGNFTISTGAQGASKLAFAFSPLAGLFVPGTATCTAKFTASGYAPAPALSSTQSFTITMQQATATHFAVTAPPAAVAGSSFNTLTVTALDGGDNVVGSYSGTVHFSSTDLQAVLPANALLSGGTGTFTATLKSAGGQTISATDTLAPITGTSNAVVVSAAPATHFRVQAPGSATAGNSFNFAVTALDQYNNTDDAYAGLVHFTSSDGAATLPADSTLTFGVGSLNATLNTQGAQTITSTDTVTATINGTSGTINVP